MFLKIAAQPFGDGDFLNNFLRFFGFRGSFSGKDLSYKKTGYIFAIIIYSVFLCAFGAMPARVGS